MSALDFGAGAIETEGGGTRGWLAGLKTRARCAILNLELTTRGEVRDAFLHGRLRPEKKRNYGWSSYREIARWLGLPDPTPVRKPVVCPHCGGRLTRGKP